MNVKSIFKAIIAGGTIIGGAILGLEAKKGFTKPLPEEDEPLDENVAEEVTETADDPAEEEAEEDETAEVPED